MPCRAMSEKEGSFVSRCGVAVSTVTLGILLWSCFVSALRWPLCPVAKAAFTGAAQSGFGNRL